MCDDCVSYRPQKHFRKAEDDTVGNKSDPKDG